MTINQPDDDYRCSLGAYAIAPREVRIRVDAIEIAASVWEGPDIDKVDVILIHGAAAQRTWWDHIAPLLHVHRVVAIDLTGHGDSDLRSAYSLETWASEITMIAQQLCGPAPLLVGHSMGGHVALTAAQGTPSRFGGVLVLDSPLRRTDPAFVERRDRIASRPLRSFPSRARAIQSYRTYPPVRDAPTDVLAHIAERAYQRTADGWTLKFDPTVYRRPQIRDGFVRPAQIPTWWVRVDHGLVDEGMAQHIGVSLGPNGAVVPFPHAGHHLMLEKPSQTADLITEFVSATRR